MIAIRFMTPFASYSSCTSPASAGATCFLYDGTDTGSREGPPSWLTPIYAVAGIRLDLFDGLIGRLADAEDLRAVILEEGMGPECDLFNQVRWSDL